MNCRKCKNKLTDTKDPNVKLCNTCKIRYILKSGLADNNNAQPADRVQNVKIKTNTLSLFCCKTCGGKEYTIVEGDKYRCEYCFNIYDNVKELPFECDLSQAENLRQAAEFETARSIYQAIIKTYPNDNLTSAYWGLFLCDYNVVFEMDGKGERFPSFYRVQTSSCLDNPNYRKAIDYCSDFEPQNTKKLKDLAGRVEYARKMYWDIADKEKSFDIFICFRNDNAESTNIASRLYFNLSKKYKVFYSNETLSVLKSSYRDYEPNIYNALYTAKVMLLICKDRAGIESQWVKNEWSRFAALNKKANMNKTIIPIFLDGFNPNDLPDQLWHSQGLFSNFEMLSKLEKQLEHYFPIEQTNQTPSQTQTTNITPLLNQMWVNIRVTQNFDKAKELATKVLESDINCASAWLALAFCDYNVCSEEDLANNDNYADNRNIKMAIRYATGDDKANLDKIHQLYLNNQEQKKLAKLEQERKLAEQKRLEEEIRIAEQKRIEEEKRLAEQRRLEEERRKAELPQVNGDTVTFGTYPQSLVTDQSIINALGGFDRNSWTSYKYYIEGKVQDYMYYIDKTYNGNKYRGVYFNQYRPCTTIQKSREESSYQIDNGYLTNKIYWFKYEPIKWKIVSNSGGYATIVTDLILDSQNYYITSKGFDTLITRSDYQGNSASAYENNYQYSTIRSWLNTTFINTAFNRNQQGIIQTTVVDNSLSATVYSGNKYTCPNTNDKVWLLSSEEAGSYFSNDQSRQKKGSDYALSQGLYRNSGTVCSVWWLRSPNYYTSYYAWCVRSDGSFLDDYVYRTDDGVVPALKIKL